VTNTLFGENLRKLRKEKNLTQKELAEYLGVTGRTIGYYESGERFPSPETINRIADLFNVSLDWLFGRTNIRTPIIQVSEKPNEYNDNALIDNALIDNASNDEYLISLDELKEFLNQKRRGKKK
jgi:transcriptional regulator with XRE-family HTH domain